MQQKKQYPRKKDEEPHVRISKTLSYVLRHGAAKEGIPIRADGYVKISDLLQWVNLKGATVDIIHQIVADNNKKRFETQMIDINGIQIEHIRAVQGHSINSIEDELILEKIKDPNLYPVVIHGTFFQAWDLIKDTGLKTMGRNHIHFAVGMPGDKQVISGMRNTCQVFIELNLKLAMQDGMIFYVSKNNVILSAGFDKVISPKYFKSVRDFKGNVLYKNQQTDEQFQQQQDMNQFQKQQ